MKGSDLTRLPYYSVLAPASLACKWYVVYTVRLIPGNSSVKLGCWGKTVRFAPQNWRFNGMPTGADPPLHRANGVIDLHANVNFPGGFTHEGKAGAC